jgi:hypothetical protein
MNSLVKALIQSEICTNENEAITEIEQMQSDLNSGEDIHDLLLAYDLTLDDAVDVFLFST